MQNLFFFGTLRHLPLLEVVLGRDAAHLSVSPAVLPGYAVSAVPKEPFPTIAIDPTAQALGLLVENLTSQDIARLDFYEGSFGYDLTPVVLTNGRSAEVYVPQPGQWSADGPWSLEDWITTNGDMSVHAAAEVMGYFGTRTRDQVAAMFPMIRARAASVVRAKQARHGRDVFRGPVEIEKRTRAYADFWALDDMKIRHARFDGTMSDTLDRAVLVAVDAAFVLPYDPVRDRVLLVEQVRMGAIARGDDTCWFMETIAGRVDPGETPQDAARREALEEAGLEIAQMETIAEIYPTAGSSTEFFYLYLGLADLPDTITGTGGLEAEHEDIRSHLWSFEELMARVTSFDVGNAVLVTSAYYLAQNRDRLRSEGAGATPQ